MNARIRVLIPDAVIAIDGVRYRHHPNGGGLVAVDAQVDPTAFVSLESIVHSGATIEANVQLDGRITVHPNNRVRTGACWSGVLNIR